MLTKSTFPINRINLSQFSAGATTNVAPTLVSQESFPLRDMIAKSLEDANLFYVASYAAPVDTTKIWLDLNGANQGESRNLAGEYKVYKDGAWSAMTQADLGKIISAHTLIDGVTITRNTNGELVASSGGGGFTPTLVGNVFSGFIAGKSYHVRIGWVAQGLTYAEANIAGGASKVVSPNFYQQNKLDTIVSYPRNGQPTNSIDPIIDAKGLLDFYFTVGTGTTKQTAGFLLSVGNGVFSAPFPYTLNYFQGTSFALIQAIYNNGYDDGNGNVTPPSAYAESNAPAPLWYKIEQLN